MILNVLTPTKKLVTDLEISEVVVPAFQGELNILPGHSPLMSTLQMGVVKYKDTQSAEFKEIVISWGYLEVNPNSINILSETAEAPQEIDFSRAVAAMKEAHKMLGASDLTIAEMEKYQRKLQRAELRKTVAESYKH